MLLEIMPTQLITPTVVERLADDVLLSRLITAVANHRRHTIEILVMLGEVEARKLHLQQGFTTLFMYCICVLRFSESEAYHRIGAARTLLRFPDVRDMLLAGSLTLTTINLLGPHLTLENYPTLLRAAAGKTKEEVRALVAPLAPKPDVHTLVRRLRPATATASSSAPDRSPSMAR